MEPPSNYQSLGILAKMLLVTSQKGLECLKGLESLKSYGPLSNIVYFGTLFTMFFVIAREGLERLECFGVLSNYLKPTNLSKMQTFQRTSETF